jgi:prepilin signal peptidase PulO-like enzyme (type II secretory pathway)
MDKTAQLIAAVLIMSFVLERIIAAVMFLFDKESPDRWRTIGRIALGGALAAIAVWKIDVRVLRDGMHVITHPRADTLLTWLVLVAGADKISSFTVAAPKAASAPAPKPEIHVFVENEKGEPKPAAELS